MRFSIVIPVFNGEKFIGKAIQSCISQTYSDFEILVIDNASTDDTKKIVNDFDDPRIRYVYTDKKGRSNARNIGIDLSIGDYIQFLDADDELEKNKLFYDSNIIDNNPNLSFLQSVTKKISQNKKIEIPPYSKSDFKEHIYLGNTIPISSAIIKREKCAKFPIGIEHCEDWYFWIKSLKQISNKEIFFSNDNKDVIVHIHGFNTGKDVEKMYVYAYFVRLKFLEEKLGIKNTIKRLVLLTEDFLRYKNITDDLSIVNIEIKKNIAYHYFCKFVYLIIPKKIQKKYFDKQIKGDFYNE
ncbi:glycosyltransferase [Streptococcus suis]